MLKYATATIDLKDLDYLRRVELDYMDLIGKLAGCVQAETIPLYTNEYPHGDVKDVALLTVDINQLIEVAKEYVVLDENLQGFHMENAIIAKLQ